MQIVHWARFCKQEEIITLLLCMSTITGNYIWGWLLCTGTVTSPGWLSPVHVAGLSPAQYMLVCILLGRSRHSFFLGQVWPIRKKISKNYFKKLWCFANLLLHFDQYRFVFLYCKDTNPVWKYSVFVRHQKNKIKIKIFCFHAYDQVSQK